MDTVCFCNKLFGKKTEHPLVSVIDFSEDCLCNDITPNCYSVLVLVPSEKEYGWKPYDFSDATMLFAMPGKQVRLPSGARYSVARLLLFHTDLLSCTQLGGLVRNYTYFKYNSSEALHLSIDELATIDECMDDISREIKWGIDKFSATIISNKIEMLLNYGKRYYNRQFITRDDANDNTWLKIYDDIEDYLGSSKIRLLGVPCACMLARGTSVSSAYLSDIVKHETGKNLRDYVEFRYEELKR